MNEPVFQAVSDHAVLIEFGQAIDQAISDRIHAFDRVFCNKPPKGFLEAVPAYVSILLLFDPLVTNHAEITAAAKRVLVTTESVSHEPKLHELSVCYDVDLAPDLAKVAELTGMDADAVINAHLGGDYRVAMYGFAPGYAYLTGLASEIQLPRKTTPVRDVAKGSVIIAGAQCIVTTLKMPAGWWRIGASRAEIFLNKKERPFLFDVGDRVKFKRVDRDTFEQNSPAVSP